MQMLMDLVEQQESHLQLLQAMANKSGHATFKTNPALISVLPHTSAHAAEAAGGVSHGSVDSGVVSVPLTPAAADHPMQNSLHQQQQPGATSRMTNPSRMSNGNCSFGSSSVECMMLPVSHGKAVDAPLYCLLSDTASARSRSSQPMRQYCHQLLMSATLQQWQQAASRTAEEWSEYYQDMVMQICCIKQLLQRHRNWAAFLESAATSSLPAAISNGARVAHAAAPAEPKEAGHICRDDAAEPSPEGTDVCGSSLEELMASLYTLVDDLVLNMNLGVVQDSVALREAALRNRLTKEVAVSVSPLYWRRVVDSLKLTQQQVVCISISSWHDDQLCAMAMVAAGLGPWAGPATCNFSGIETVNTTVLLCE